MIGVRALVTLPHANNFYQSLSFGMDYKHFNQGVKTVAGEMVSVTPISYYPISANYSATWEGKRLETKEKNPDPNALTVYQSTTELNTGVTLHLRGMGSSTAEFDSNRFKADGDFIYLRGDLSHTQELPGRFQAYAKVQGQVSDQPLVNSEQFSGGGLTTVRGYLESEVLGDNAILGTAELRSPSLLGWLPAKDRKGSEWRIYVFGDAGRLSIRSPLPEQQSRFELASYGIGSRIRLADHLNGSIDAAVPLISSTDTNAHDVLVTFRLWADFCRGARSFFTLTRIEITVSSRAKSHLLRSLLCWGLALLAFPGAARAWWNADWTLRRKITLDTTSSGAGVTDPIGAAVVLIRLHEGNFSFNGAKDDGSDLRFVAEDDKTLLTYHIESAADTRRSTRPSSGSKFPI